VTQDQIELLEVDAPSMRRTAAGAVVLDWWCDLACPDCATSVELLDDLRERYADDLEIRLRHFPLTNHVWAVAAAQCQVEADAQGMGPTYAAHALAALDTIEGPADYVELAEHLGIDDEEVAVALFDGRHAGTVRRDADEGRKLGVTGTPTFVVDGLLVGAGSTLDGALDVVARRIESALGR
jgi:predicted DsbA family dithiol-disulfide isomerase